MCVSPDNREKASTVHLYFILDDAPCPFWCWCCCFAPASKDALTAETFHPRVSRVPISECLPAFLPSPRVCADWAQPQPTVSIPVAASFLQLCATHLARIRAPSGGEASRWSSSVCLQSPALHAAGLSAGLHRHVIVTLLGRDRDRDLFMTHDRVHGRDWSNNVSVCQ